MITGIDRLALLGLFARFAGVEPKEVQRFREVHPEYLKPTRPKPSVHPIVAEANANNRS